MSRIFAASAVVISVVFLAQGCGPETPTFDPKTSYTADSVAQEFLFRYKAIGSPPARGAAEKKAPAPNTKAKETTKKASASTLDDLIDETAGKVRLIREGTIDENTKKVIDAVSRESTIPDADKTLIGEKLRQAVKAKD